MCQFRFLSLGVSLITLTLTSYAQAAEIHPLDDLTNFSYLSVSGVSDDGSAIAGSGYDNFGNQLAYRWTQSTGATALGGFAPNAIIEAKSISGDGDTVVGSGLYNGTDFQAFRWTQGGGFAGIGFLQGGTLSFAAGTNTDGSVVVGVANTGVDPFARQAYRWTSGTGMVGLGYLGAASSGSWAEGVSGDGNVVVGYAHNADGIHTEAFRWDAVNGMVSLGYLTSPVGAYLSQATATNSDGSIVLGFADNGADYEAFKWDAVNGMVGLGHLSEFIWGGWQNGNRSTSYDMTDDGSIIVGTANAPSTYHAFVWTQADGMVRLTDILSARGANLTGWLLTSATGIDSTGTIIVGDGSLNGVSAGFISNLVTGGLTTPGDLLDGLAGGLVPVEQTQSTIKASLGQSLFASTQILSNVFLNPLSASQTGQIMIAPAAGDDFILSPSWFERQWSAYAVGTFGIGQENDFDNHAVNGTTGLSLQITKDTAIGLGIIGSDGNFDLPYDGDSSLKTMGGSLVAAHKGEDGLRLYGTAYVAHLDVDNDRHYLSGVTIDSSNGQTQGTGYGLALRGGWEFDAGHNIDLMPYAEIQATRTRLDGYTETGGGFPATFGATTSTNVISLLGTQLSYNVSPTMTVSGRMAWAHNLHDNDNGLNVSAAGFTGTLNGERGDRNWAEGSVSANWEITKTTHLSAELGGRSGKTAQPIGTLSLGLITKF